MKQTLYAVVVVTVSMLVTSGIVALAYSAPRLALPEPAAAQAEAFVSAQIDLQYHAALARRTP